jgi:hypothetical protein
MCYETPRKLTTNASKEFEGLGVFCPIYFGTEKEFDDTETPHGRERIKCKRRRKNRYCKRSSFEVKYIQASFNWCESAWAVEEH